jgi:hypothetical protein
MMSTIDIAYQRIGGYVRQPQSEQQSVDKPQTNMPSIVNDSVAHRNI